MKRIKMLGLAIAATVSMTALFASAPANAEPTALCDINEYPCPVGHRVSGATLELSSGAVWSLHTTKPTLTILCLSTELAVEGLEPGSPQYFHRASEAHTSCGTTKEHNNCTVTAFFEGAEFELLKTDSNLGQLTPTGGETSVECTGLPKIECTYKDASATYHFKGATSGGHGMVSAFEEPIEAAGGKTCPEKTILGVELEFTEDVYLGGEIPSKEEGYGPDNPGDPYLCKVCKGDPFDTATGNLTETQTDLSLNGRGPSLAVTRSYNSQLAASQPSAGIFGYGWTGPYSAYLVVDEETETATVHHDNGSTTVFFLSEGQYVPGAWSQATLAKEGENYVYKLPSQETLEFNSSGQLITVTDRHGNALTLTYKEGKLETVKDASSRALTFAYTEGKVSSVKDPMGHEAKYTYESGNLKSVTLPGDEAARWKFKYDGSHRLTELTDGRGNTTTNEYDASSRITLQTDPLENKRKLEYGGSGEIKETSITEPNGSTTLEKFNQANEPIEVIRAYGTELAQTHKYEYNSTLSLVKVTDPNNHVTTFGYDAEGNRTSRTDANENETKWVYNNAHELIEEVTPGKETTTITRTESGDPKTIKRSVSETETQETKFKYGENGDLEEETDPLGHATKFEYNSYGNRTATINPAGDKTTWTYDESGRAITEVSGRGNAEGAEPSEFESKTERDAQGRAIKATDPLGNEVTYKYDANGNLEALVNGNGNTTTYTYDANNRLIETKAANGDLKKAAYDSEGKVKSRTDGNSKTTTYARNSLEQVTKVTDPLERTTTRKYDAAGNLKEVQDPEERKITYSYDPGDRPEEINYSDPETPDVVFKYDKDGNVIEMTDGSGTTQKAYDKLDRLTEVEDGNEEVVEYTYDLASHITKITYPNGKSVTRAFDSAGRLEKITDWLGGETTVAYNSDSNTSSITYPAESENKDEYTYNEADQLTKTTMKKGAETLSSIGYGRGSVGQVTSATQTGLPGAEKPEYEYDTRERLKKGAGTSFGYDAANNPTTVGASALSYDGASQLEKAGTTEYSFNNMGERTEAIPATGPSTKYGFDQAGNLASVKRTEEGGVTKIEDAYTYDGNGLRASETINGVTTNMTWDTSDELPLLLYDGVNYYIYGPFGLPIEQISSETPTYLHHDQQGSTRLLTNSEGETEGTYTYAPFGAVEGHIGKASTPLGYGGQYRSEDTGLIYLRARAYDPSTAQFMSVDPQVAQSGESYAYAEDNPVNVGDPTGELVFGYGYGNIGIHIGGFNAGYTGPFGYGPAFCPFAWPFNNPAENAALNAYWMAWTAYWNAWIAYWNAVAAYWKNVAAALNPGPPPPPLNIDGEDLDAVQRR